MVPTTSRTTTDTNTIRIPIWCWTTKTLTFYFEPIMDINFNDSLGMTSLEFNNREIVLFALLCERLISEEKIWDILPTYCDEEVVNDILAFGTEISTRIPAHSRKHIFCAPSGD